MPGPMLALWPAAAGARPIAAPGTAAKGAGGLSTAGVPRAGTGCSSSGARWPACGSAAAVPAASADVSGAWKVCCGSMRLIRDATSVSRAAAALVPPVLPKLLPLLRLLAGGGAAAAGGSAEAACSSKGAAGTGCGAAAGAPVLHRNSSAARSSAPAAAAAAGCAQGGWRRRWRHNLCRRCRCNCAALPLTHGAQEGGDIGAGQRGGLEGRSHVCVLTRLQLAGCARGSRAIEMQVSIGAGVRGSERFVHRLPRQRHGRASTICKQTGP